MPVQSQKPCCHPGCGKLVPGGVARCQKHLEQRQQEDQKRQQQYDKRRGTSAQRGYGSRWKKVRVTYLQSHPLCVRCGEEGRLTPASVVDHIVPHKGDVALFWNSNNWQSLCKTCHDVKTATEDGGGWGGGKSLGVGDE